MIELRRILCPVDFSRTTAQGVEAGVSLATEFGAELVLLNVSEPRHPFLDDAGIGLETALLRDQWREVTMALGRGNQHIKVACADGYDEVSSDAESYRLSEDLLARALLRQLEAGIMPYDTSFSTPLPN